MRIRLVCVFWLVICAFCRGGFAANIKWQPDPLLPDPTPTYTIPNDGNTWFLDYSFSLTSSFFVEGAFEVRSGGELLIDADVVDGSDAVGVTQGVDGDNLSIEVHGSVSVMSGGEISFITGAGGAGGNVSSGTGGSGGDGGQILFSGAGAITVASGGTFSMRPGIAGAGGNGSGSGSIGGEGGGSGGIAVVFGPNIRVEDGGYLKIVTGTGGNGGNGSGAGTGGDGGGGALVLFASSRIDLAGDLSFTLSFGSGGDGGDDSDGSSFGGNGGDGGLFGHFFDFLVSVVGDSSFNLAGGRSGGGGSGSGGGDGGVQGSIVPLSEDPGKILVQFRDSTVDVFSYSDPVITLSQRLDIDFTWTITKDKTIFGNGNQVVLGPNGAIVLDGAVKGGGIRVMFDSLEIEGIGDYDVRCIDDDSEVFLRDVRLNLDSDYTFSKGAMTIDGSCVVDGALTTLLYESSQPLTINSSSELKIVPRTILEYASTPNNLIQMTSGTSTLHLNNATLLSTEPLSLTTGVLSTEGLAILQGTGQLSIAGLSDIIVRGGLARVGNVTL
ncbi:hypothetical protein KKA53_00840 [Candidatus Dependentiae bacterium]|nr:hypothetical protein [Candidatus Dependentiae bacterium]